MKSTKGEQDQNEKVGMPALTDCQAIQKADTHESIRPTTNVMQPIFTDFPACWKSVLFQNAIVNAPLSIYGILL